jgi:molybdate transport system substrate-binding protein
LLRLWRAFPVLLTISLVAGCGGAARPGPSPAQTERGGPKSTGPIQLIAFVGSASKPPASAAKAAYEKAHPNVSIDMTFGGSGTLLQQMSLEKMGDIYMPGSDDYMEKAEAKQAVIPETRRIVAYLVPMICVQKGNPKGIKTLADLANPGVIVGLAEPGAVCLGDVSAEILENAGLLAAVRKNIITYAKSCEQTQQLVQLGEVDAVIGWDAFASWAPDKIEVIPIPLRYGRPRNIPAAVSAFSQQREAAERFIEFLTSSEGKAIFAKHGYSVEPPKQ